MRKLAELSSLHSTRDVSQV